MLLSELYLYLVMAMLMDCPLEPVTEDEKDEITQAAYNARSEALAGKVFESISVTKCITHWEGEGPDRVKGRTEYVNFYGLFPYTTQTESYRERYSIRCHKSVDYPANSVFHQSDSCTEEIERYMQYDGLDHEVQLRDSVPIEDAVAYLDYLMQYGFGKDDQNRATEMLRRIQWVGFWSDTGGQLRFRAAVPSGSCATTILESTAEREHALVFRKVYKSLFIC